MQGAVASALAAGIAEYVGEAPDGPVVVGDAQPATMQATARSDERWHFADPPSRRRSPHGVGSE